MNPPALIDLKRFHGLLLISVSLLASFSLLVTQASVAGEPDLEGEAKAKLAEAFEAVAEAEKTGGNVSQLVEELNQAIALHEEAMLNETILKAEDVIVKATAVGREGAAAAQARIVQSGVTIGLIAILAVIVWRYGPRLFWRFWVRSKKNWRVKACS